MNVGHQRWALAVSATLVTTALVALAWWMQPGWFGGGAVGPGAGFAPAGTVGVLLDPSTHWRHATHNFEVGVTTNALGLRGPEVIVPKPADHYRVLALGDSFTFGWGVEYHDAWHARVAEELQATDGRPMEVVVAGIPGWSPLQQFVFLEQRGLDLQPDLVIWQLCSNDMLEMERLEVEIDARRLPIKVAIEPPLSAGLRAEWLDALERFDEPNRKRLEAEYRAGRVDPVLRELALAADVARREQAGAAPEGEVTDLRIEDVVRGLRSGPDFGVRYVDHLVSAARELCAERGMELRLMLAQARPTPRPAGERDDGVAALRAWAARQFPRTLDTADLLPEERVDEFYFSDDPHWRPAAHPLVAQAVAHWLAGDPELALSLAPEH